jgi:hypothetical protein
MAKQKITTFTCDQCSNEISVRNDDGFPYKLGWNYIYKFEANISKDAPNKMIKSKSKINIEDSHLCSKHCMIEYIKEKIDYASDFQGGQPDELETQVNRRSNNQIHNLEDQRPFEQQPRQEYKQTPNFNANHPQQYEQLNQQTQQHIQERVPEQHNHTISNPFEKPDDGKPQIVEPETAEKSKKKNWFR